MLYKTCTIAWKRIHIGCKWYLFSCQIRLDVDVASCWAPILPACNNVGSCRFHQQYHRNFEIQCILCLIYMYARSCKNSRFWKIFFIISLILQNNRTLRVKSWNVFFTNGNSLFLSCVLFFGCLFLFLNNLKYYWKQWKRRVQFRLR